MEKREATFLKYGFTRCAKEIPRRAAALQHLLGIFSSCIKGLGLIPMSIEKEVLGTFQKQINLSATGFTPITQGSAQDGPTEVSPTLQVSAESSSQTNVGVTTLGSANASSTASNALALMAFASILKSSRICSY